jgi:hypothetical protein
MTDVQVGMSISKHLLFFYLIIWLQNIEILTKIIFNFSEIFCKKNFFKYLNNEFSSTKGAQKIILQK